jgi:outer membrane protein TolC
MKNLNVILALILLNTLAQNSIAQDDVSVYKPEKKSDILEEKKIEGDIPTDAAVTSEEDKAVAPPTETATDGKMLEENMPKTPADSAESSAKKVDKNEVLSEEELIKPKAKKSEKNESSEVKVQAVTETEIYVQEANKYKVNDVFKNLQLNDVIEQGLRKNYSQNIKEQQNELNEVEFKGIKSAFWLPELKINLTTDSQRISTLRSSKSASGNQTSLTPTGVLGLSLGNYTVFNWGKDYALYLNSKSTFQRNKQGLDEARRELKLDLISNFFSLMTSKNIEKIRLDQLRNASFLYRLSKEKVTIGRISKQDYYQARSEYLIAQNDYHEAKMNSDIADENMAYMIVDDTGTKYILNETLDYKRVKITLDETIELAKKNNPTLLNNQVTIQNAERSYDVAVKENLPLPKLSVDLGAYNKRFGSTTNRTVFENQAGNGDIELVASINASWSISGEDGLFNSNKLAISRLNKEISLKEFEKNTHYTQSLVRQTFKNILSLQNQMAILEARVPTLQKTFDIVLENYLAQKVKYNDYHLALRDLIATRILFEEIKLRHLKEKILLAKLAGLEDFPGENFEQLAIRVKGK